MLKTLTYKHEDKPASTSHPAAAEAPKLHAAHVSGLENFPLFAAAMIVGNDAGLANGTLNALGFGYLLSRGAYTWLYVTATKEKTSYVR